ncbi:MAG TPA: hypothetical protein VKU41_13990 [Polyangiaceae bacterium]|nr:hypothetical protein [Polyangiaceae bacterium]
MTNFDPLHAAKKVAEHAAQVAADATGRASDLRELVRGKIGDIKESTLAGVKDLVDDFNRHLPALQEAGYTLTEVAVEMGLTPKIVATFSSRPDITQERIDAVVEEHRDAKVTVAMIRTLFAAYKLQNGLHIVGMKPRGICVEIGVAPAIVVKFA